jgi:hypothetical protein
VIFRDACSIFISQSGEIAETMAALEYCKRAGALLSITRALSGCHVFSCDRAHISGTVRGYSRRTFQSTGACFPEWL